MRTACVLVLLVGAWCANSSIQVTSAAGNITHLAASAGPKPYYLSMGDSFAYGKQPNGDNTHGYSDDLFSAFGPLGTSQLINLGCPGATSTDMVSNPCAFSTKYPYTGPQLAAAVAFINAHPGQVSPVTIDVGTNDVKALYNASTCTEASNSTVTAALATFDSNLTAILSQLQTALAGTGDLLIMTNFFARQNQCPNLVQLEQLFNSHIVTAAQANGALVADVFTAFGGATTPNPNLCNYTWICSSYADIHPTTLGYSVIAQTFEQAAGYSATPTSTPTSSPTATPTNTPIPPTNTPVPPTNTPVPPTNTPVPPTNTPVPPTAVPTNTLLPPTAVPTDTPAPTATPTSMPTDTPIPPTSTQTPTNTPIPPPPTDTSTSIPTNTAVPPTNTPTSAPPTSTPTSAPVPSNTVTLTNTPVVVPASQSAGTQSGTILTQSGSDSYTFVPGSSGPANIGSCAVNPNSNFIVGVYDSGNNLLGSGTSTSYCNWVNVNVTAGQTYTVTTTAVSGTGDYRSAWNVNGAQVVWNAAGSIDTVGGSQTFSFLTLGTGTVSVSTCGPSGAEYSLTLLSASGNVLSSAASESNCQALNYTPSGGDLFRLQVVSEEGAGSWSGTVSTERTAEIPMPRLSGTQGGRSLASQGSSDTYLFTAAASGPASIGSCAKDINDVYSVTVYDSSGNMLGSGANASYCNWVDLSVTATQTYTVTTTALSGTGLYRSSWNINGSQVTWYPTGSISTAGANTLFSFPALSTGQISLSICGPSGTTYALNLLNAAGAVLASSSAASNCQALNYAPAGRDLYRLQVVAITGTGAWTGMVSTERSTGIPTPRLSGTQGRTIAASGGSDSYLFTPAASGTASIGSCSRSIGNQDSVTVYDSSGSILGSGTNASYCNWVSAPVTAGETYIVTTTAVSGSGDYRSSWNVNGAPITWYPTGSISTVGGSGVFSFPILSAATISLSICGPAGNTYDLYLLSASYSTLASATASSNCQTLNYTPTNPDLFRLEVVAATGTGPWTGTVTTQ